MIIYIFLFSETFFTTRTIEGFMKIMKHGTQHLRMRRVYII